MASRSVSSENYRKTSSKNNSRKASSKKNTSKTSSKKGGKKPFVKKEFVITPEMEEQKKKNLTGEVVVIMARLPNHFQPLRFWDKCVEGIEEIWEDFGKVKDVSFKQNKSSNSWGAIVQFKEDTLSEEIIEALRENGKISLERELRAPRNWDYTRGEPLRKWRYDVYPSTMPFLSREERRAKKEEFNKRSRKTKLVLCKKKDKKNKKDKKDKKKNQDNNDDNDDDESDDEF